MGKTDKKIDDLTIAEKLAKALEKAKRPARLAKSFGVSRQFIGQIINTDRPFPIDREADLTEYLKTGKVAKVENVSN